MVTFEKESFCETCTLIAAGYDSHELGIEEDDMPVWDESIAYATPSGDGEPHFGSHPCDACGTREAGNRCTVLVEYRNTEEN